jgi:hypothetical protein
VWTAGGQVLAIEPNSAHPLAYWFDPIAAEALLAAPAEARWLDGPAQAEQPFLGVRRPGPLRPLPWTAAVGALSAILRTYHPSEIAIVVGEFPGHLHDLAQRLAAALGAAAAQPAATAQSAAGVLRFSPAALVDGRVALQDAAWQVFGLARLPLFDLERAELVAAFGIQGDEPWLAAPARRGASAAQSWVIFDHQPRAYRGGEWVQIRPGSYAHAARALAHGVARLRAGVSAADLAGELAGAAGACGLEAPRLAELCRRFAASARALALPGGWALAGDEGVLAARMILALNAAVGSLGTPGGVFLPLDAPLHADLETRPATLEELAALIERIRLGQIKALLVHGADLVGGLPSALDAPAALQKLEHLVSFDAAYNETSAFASLLLPGLLPLETRGYQRALIGANRPLVAALQPALAAGPGPRSAADTLLAAARLAGLSVPYQDEEDFIHKSLRRLRWPHGAHPLARWQAQGGWWTDAAVKLPAVSVLPAQRPAAALGG